MSLGDIRPAAKPWPAAILPRMRAATAERLLLAATVLAAVGLLWLVPRLPMTDLPQHAAQVALWRDLLLGRSAWSDLVHINLITPYLIGYGLTLPLAFILPIETAMRITLSAGLVGFVVACLALRRRFGGDPRLDWLFPVGFFGFAWQWGFFTFLVASPVALAFLLVVHRACTDPDRPRQGVVVAVGLLLLLSHGLLFAVFLPIGAAMAFWAARERDLPGLGRALVPFAALALACAAFRLMAAQTEGAMRYDTIQFGSDLWLKPLALLMYVTNVDLPAAQLELPLSALLLLAPLMLRCRLNTGLALVPFLAFVPIVLAVPSYAFQTALLFHRFALFLLPLYALMFRPPAPAASGSGRRAAAAVPILVCWIVLGTQAERIRAFAAEIRPFETVLNAAEPGKRALSLIFDKASPGAANATAYMHVPLWYEADKGGFVDFNFADFHPQIVRFRADRRPAFTTDLGWHPDDYVGRAEYAALFDYVFVRGSGADVARVIDRNACPLTVRAVDGPWTLLERGACPGM